MTAKRKADSEWSRLKSQLSAQRRGLGQLCKDISAATSATNGDSITGYNVMKEELAAWERAAAETTAELNKSLETLRIQSTEALETLDERIARGLRAAGLEVYGETGLLIVDGVVHIEIDKKKGLIKANGATPVSVTVESITAEVKSELERLRASSTPPTEFVKMLLQAYESEIAGLKKPFGTQVTTMQLICPIALLKQQPQFRMNPVAANFREYSKDRFRADLYALLKSSSTLIGGKRFSFASGSDTAGALFMLVPQYGRAAHVGRIWFEHSEG